MSHRAALIASLAITILVALSVAVGPRSFIAGGSDNAAITATAPLSAEESSGPSVQVLTDADESTRQPPLPRSQAPQETVADDRDDDDEDDDDQYENERDDDDDEYEDDDDD